VIDRSDWIPRRSPLVGIGWHLPASANSGLVYRQLDWSSFPLMRECSARQWF